MNLPCKECGGTCCKTMYGVVLDDDSALWFENGRCPNLTADNRCGIYETRPRACREFDCSKDADFLRENPKVVTVLTVHGVPMAA